MATETTADLDALKDRHRRMWASGDYSQSARYIGPVGPELVRRLSLGPGRRVLDVATGTGLAAIPAAKTGATVTGLDLTPALLEVAQRRASAESVYVTWLEGDAKALPFADASFDCVLSTFGIQFAPRHERTAAELARVCAPGGVLGLCNWTPAGFIGRLLALVSRYLPAPPSGASPPPPWGDRGHVEELLGDAFALEWDTGIAEFTEETPAAFVDSFASWYGPLLTARETLSADGRWADLRAELIELTTDCDRGEDGTRVPSEYLVIIGRRASDAVPGRAGR